MQDAERDPLARQDPESDHVGRDRGRRAATARGPDAAEPPLARAGAARLLERGLEQLEGQDGPALTAALAHGRPLVPLAVRAIHDRLELVARAAVVAAPVGDAASPDARVTRVHAEVLGLLAAHDRIAPPPAIAAAAPSWAGDDLRERDGAARAPRDVGALAVETTPAVGPSPVAAPALPVSGDGHLSRELSVDVKRGNLTGAITATVELGRTGVGGSLGPVELKALENTATLKLDGFAAKLQAALLTLEGSFEALDGVQIAVEANGASVAVDGDETTLELASFAVKLVGDISHWLDLPKGVVTIDGRLTLAVDAPLRATLARRLAVLKAAQLEMRILTKEVEDVAAGLAKEDRAYRELVAKRQALSPHRGRPQVAAQLKKLEGELVERRRALRDGARQLEGLVTQLDDATRATNAAFGKLRGNLARAVGRAMRTKGLQLMAKAVARAIPVVNVLVTIIDVVELAVALRRLQKYGQGDGDGDGASATPSGAGDGGGDPGQGAAGSMEGPVTMPSQVEGVPAGPVRHPDGSMEPPTSRTQGPDPHHDVLGPVTHPGQRSAAAADPVAIAFDLPLAVVATWIALRGGDVVETGARAAWERAHAGQHRGDTVLRSVQAHIERTSTAWDLRIAFQVEVRERAETWSHGFWVTEVHGRLELLPYIEVGLRTRTEEATA